jgi:uncharacterized protein (DUF2336 family)
MKQQSGRLQGLLSLPHESSAKKRQAVLAEIAQLFRERSAASMRETQELGESLLRLLPKLDTGDRAFLAAQLAKLKEAPSYLVRELSGDPVPAVAAPILAESILLTEEDLLRSAAKGGDERLTAIARRPELPRAVQMTVAKSGNGAALDALLNNKALRPAPELLGPLMTKARGDARLAATLARRSDVPTGALAELFFSLTTEDRVRLTQDLARDEDDALPVEQSITGEASLVRAARANDPVALARALSVHWQLPDAVVRRVLEDPACEALAVLCLGLGIARATYSTIVLLVHAPGSASQVTASLGMFARFSASGARRLALEWQRAGAERPREPRLPMRSDADSTPRAPKTKPAHGVLTPFRPKTS